ncbi:MAG: hypothetical protein ACRD15_12700, partial [Vicinamibacterales bacterium]
EGALLLGASEEVKDEEIGVSLQTPESVRRLQRTLYVKAKKELLRRRYHVPTRGTRRFSAEQVFGPLGVLRMRPLPVDPPS